MIAEIKNFLSFGYAIFIGLDVGLSVQFDKV